MPTLLAPTPLTDTERSQTLTEIEQVLQAAMADLAAAPPAPGQRAPGRPPILPALCLWTGLLACVLHGSKQFVAKATAILKQDIDALPFPDDPAELQLCFATSFFFA